MFYVVDTSSLSLSQYPLVERDDSRVMSRHRTREAAEAAIDKQVARLRRKVGSSCFLFRDIAEL
jgi:hypothetical protein